MENTTLKLWKCEGFASNSINDLYIGKTPNGQDCIAFTRYSREIVEVFSYQGIIETFLNNLKKYNSIDLVLAHTKTDQSNPIEVFLYDDDFRSRLPKYSHIRYSFIYQFLNNQKNVEVIKNLSDLRPQWVIFSLRRQGILNCEKQKAVDYKKQIF